MGYCPGGACTTVKAPLTTPTVSPFLPPACRAGTGSGNWGGLCSYACNYGFCPMHICSCTAQGALVQTPPKTLNVTGSPVGGQKDYGLCDFACPRGYCPPGACTATNNTGSSRGTPVYIDPSIWGQPSPTVTCMPPCVIVLPPYTLPAPTIVSFKPVTTTLTEAWVAGCVFTTVVTVAWAPITTTAIPVYNLNITSSGIDSVVYTVTPSLLPSTAVTFKPPSSCIPAMTSASSSTTPIVVIFTSTRDPSSTWPIVTGQPTTVHFSSAYPPGPTCTANGGCGGSMCEHWCNSCGPVGCSGGDTYGEDDTDPGCNGCGGTSNPSGGGSSSGCVGPVCPKPHPPGTEGGGHDDPSENNPCQADVNNATGLCLNGNYPVWDPVADIVSCDFSAAEAPEYMTACQEEIDEDIADSKDDAQDSHDCCPAKRMGGVSPLESHASGAACPVNPDFPNNKPPVNKPYHSVFTCDYKLWPNVCANAKSAIERRGKSPLMTYAGPGGNLHVTNPWYGSKAGAGSAPKARNPKPDKFLGWGLAGCQVEEYPWGSGNPNRQPNMKVWDEQSVLRLIPRAENGDHGNALSNFYTAAGNKNIQNAVGLIYSVSFVNGPTGTTDKDFYLDEADPHSKDINICAKAYGVAFLLVDRVGKMNPRETSYDPWWDNRLFTKTTRIQTKKDGSTTLLVSAALPSAYCSYPSPGKKQYVNGAWVPMPGASTLPRKRGNRYYSCDNFPGYTGPAEMRRAKSRRGRRQLNELTSDEIHQLHAEGKNITISDGSIEVEDDDLSDPMEDIVISVPEMPRSPGAPPPVPKNSTMRLPGQRRSLTPRQAAAGSFLDPKAFDYLGCGNSDMDWCALPGADCPYDDGSSPEDDAEDGGGGDGGVTTSSPAGPTVTTTTQTAPTPTATWRIGIYSDKDCSGDYYSLEGHNSGGTLDNDCLVLRGGHLPQTSETGVSCRWFTKSGGAWADCDSSPLTHPLSWQVIGGICTAYDNTECKLGIGGSNAYLAQGCHNYGAGPWDDPATWLALKCSAGGQAQPKQFPNGTAIGNNTTTWSSRTIPLATLSAS